MALILLCFGLTACSGPTLKKDIIRDPPSYAKPAAKSGVLANISLEIAATHGDDFSGFKSPRRAA
jgi:hypothetical protein